MVKQMVEIEAVSADVPMRKRACGRMNAGRRNALCLRIFCRVMTWFIAFNIVKQNDGPHSVGCFYLGRQLSAMGGDWRCYRKFVFAEESEKISL